MAAFLAFFLIPFIPGQHTPTGTLEHTRVGPCAAL